MKKIKKVKDPEREFLMYFVKNSHKCLPRAVYLNYEFCLYSAYELLKIETQRQIWLGERPNTAKIIGKIDIIFRYKSKKYIGEIKNFDHRGKAKFWESLKVLGYTEYYKWQTEDTNVFPAILIPKKQIKLEHRIIANKLRITIFGFIKKGKEYEVNLVDD